MADIGEVAYLPGTAGVVAMRYALGAVARFARDETVYRDGERARRYYLVVDGAVRISKALSNDRRQITAFAFPGETFGFSLGGTFGTVAEAMTPATIACLSRSRVEHLAKKHPDVRHEMAEQFRLGLISARAHLALLGIPDAKRRVAAFLVHLSKNRNVLKNNVLELSMKQRDIGGYLGLTFESVSRALTTLKADGALSVLRHGRIAIADLDALEGAVCRGDRPRHEDRAVQTAEIRGRGTPNTLPDCVRVGRSID